jgi:crossover junction endodeoxyribonuclease RusA
MTVTPLEQARIVTIDVRGLPHPQGSMRTHALPNGAVAVRYPPAVWAWRHQVQAAMVAAAVGDQITAAVEVRLGFDLARPADHFGTGRNAGTLKASAPSWPVNAKSGDIDKLARAILDAATDAGLWHDDCQVASLVAAKRYGPLPGVKITITELLP